MAFRKSSLMLLLSFLLSCLTLFGQEGQKAYSISDVPNVQLSDSTRFVSDPAHYLTADEVQSLDRTLLKIRQSYNVDFAIILLPSIGDKPIENFAYELFKAWGLGQKGKDTGLLLVISQEQKKLRFETGYGLEGIIPDAFLGQVIRNDIAPNFRQGNTALGLYLAIGRISQKFEQNKVELLDGAKGRPHQQGARSKQIPSSAFFYFYSFFISLIYLSQFVGLYTAKKSVKQQRDARRLIAEANPTIKRGRFISILLFIPFLFIVFFSNLSDTADVLAMVLLVVFVLYFIALYFLGQSYQKFICQLAKHCPSCGQASLELSSNFEGQLTPQQSLEHRIKSKTFSYFQCSHCSYTELIPHIVEPRKHKLCQTCQTLAVVPVARRSVVYQGLRYLRTEYKCLYCDNQTHEDKREHREEAENLAQGLLLGALLGSGRGRSGGFSSGGGFSGGSWGGGMSGGGGASGSW